MFVLAEQPGLPAYVGWLVPVVILGVLVQMFFVPFVTIAIFKLSSAQRRYERLEDDRDAKVSALEKKLEQSEQQKHVLVEKLVDQRLQAMSHKIANEANAVLLSLKDLRDKISATEKELDGISEGKHKLEIETLERVMELKESVATRRDLQEHQHSADERFRDVSQRIGKLSEVMATKDDLDRLRKGIERG